MFFVLKLFKTFLSSISNIRRMKGVKYDYEIILPRDKKISFTNKTMKEMEEETINKFLKERVIICKKSSLSVESCEK